MDSDLVCITPNSEESYCLRICVFQPLSHLLVVYFSRPFTWSLSILLACSKSKHSVIHLKMLLRLRQWILICKYITNVLSTLEIDIVIMSSILAIENIDQAIYRRLQVETVGSWNVIAGVASSYRVYYLFFMYIVSFSLSLTWVTKKISMHLFH